MTELAKLMGAAWRELDAEGKAKYEAEAAADAERYAAECKEAGVELAPPKEKKEPKETKKETKKEKKADDEAPKGPKKPTTAYFAYCAAVRETFKEQHPEAKVTELAKLMGAAWRELDAEGKAKYEAEAAADKERYATECAEAGIEP